jgi:hypothetical protein
MVNVDWTIDSSLLGSRPRHGSAQARHRKQKKADVAEHPEVFDHVGLLINEPLGRAELLFI